MSTDSRYPTPAGLPIPATGEPGTAALTLPLSAFPRPGEETPGVLLNCCLSVLLGGRLAVIRPCPVRSSHADRRLDETDYEIECEFCQSETSAALLKVTTADPGVRFKLFGTYPSVGARPLCFEENDNSFCLLYLAITSLRQCLGINTAQVKYPRSIYPLDVRPPVDFPKDQPLHCMMVALELPVHDGHDDQNGIVVGAPLRFKEVTQDYFEGYGVGYRDALCRAGYRALMARAKRLNLAPFYMIDSDAVRNWEEGREM